MKILALETSTQTGSVAVIHDGQIMAQKSSNENRSHSENMHVFVEDCLRQTQFKLSEIDIFAVGQGPGSFTGIRVAANMGKAYAYSYQKPLISIDSLTLLAGPCLGQSNPVLAMINAHKNMVYLGLFDVSGEEPRYLKGPVAIPVRDLKDHIRQDCLVVGDGFQAFEPYFPQDLKKFFHRDLKFPDFPQAATLGLMSQTRARKDQTLDWKSFIPLYIRASEAEETKKGILISPLK